MWRFGIGTFYLAILACAVTASQKFNYAMNHYEAGLYAQAAPAFAEVADGPASEQSIRSNIALARIHEARKEPALAEQRYRSAIQQLPGGAPNDHVLARTAFAQFGLFLSRNGRQTEARQALETALSHARASGDVNLIAMDTDNLGLVAQSENRLEEALALQRESLRLVAAPRDRDQTGTKGIVCHNMAWTYEKLGRPDEAQSAHRQAIELLAESDAKRELKVAMDAYREFLVRTGRSDSEQPRQK